MGNHEIIGKLGNWAENILKSLLCILLLVNLAFFVFLAFVRDFWSYRFSDSLDMQDETREFFVCSAWWEVIDLWVLTGFQC